METSSSYRRQAISKNPYMFNGGVEYNEDTEWYETEYRQYDPAIGRFGGVDPLTHQIDGVNPYQFAYNDPVSFNDPSGLMPNGGEDGSNVPLPSGSPIGGSGTNSFSKFLGFRDPTNMTWMHDYDGYFSQKVSISPDLMEFTLDLFNASQDNTATLFSKESYQTLFSEWSSLEVGEAFALNYSDDGTVGLDVYRFTADNFGENGTYSVDLEGSFYLDFQAKAKHPGKLDLAKENSDAVVAIHLLKALRWSHVNNKKLDLNTVFDCLNTSCLFGSHFRSGTQHYSGEGRLRFGETKDVRLYFEIPYGGRRAVTFTPFEYQDNAQSFGYSIRFGRGSALFGIGVATDNKHKKLIRTFIGLDK